VKSKLNAGSFQSLFTDFDFDAIWMIFPKILKCLVISGYIGKTLRRDPAL
jgi:hypothetical protein